MPRPHLPVSEQLWSATRDTRDPVCRFPKMATQLLVFLLGPEGQISVQFAHRRVKRRAIISPIVMDPASDNWIEHPRQILDRFITALRQLPAPKFVTDRLRCLVLHRRTEVDEELPLAIRLAPVPKRISEKIKLFVWISLLPRIILAIDDFRFLRMELQSAALQSRSDGLPHFLGFLLRPAMHDDIIGVPLEWRLRVVRRQPSI